MHHIVGEQPDWDNVRHGWHTRNPWILGNGKTVLSSALLLAWSAAEGLKTGAEVVDTAVGRGYVNVLHLQISVSGRRLALHCLPVSCNDRNRVSGSSNGAGEFLPEQRLDFTHHGRTFGILLYGNRCRNAAFTKGSADA